MIDAGTVDAGTVNDADANNEDNFGSDLFQFPWAGGAEEDDNNIEDIMPNMGGDDLTPTPLAIEDVKMEEMPANNRFGFNTTHDPGILDPDVEMQDVTKEYETTETTIAETVVVDQMKLRLR